MAREIVVISVVLAVAGCKEQPAQPARADAAAAVVVTKPAPITRTATTAPVDEELVLPYLADCNYVPSIELEDMEGEKKGDECVLREFEQNCAPDTFGCWDSRQKCLDACAQPCVSCRTQCALRCKDCKSACAGKADAQSCVHACAAARAGCGKSCMDVLEKCRGPGCEHVAEDCDRGAKKRVEKECGATCEQFRECVEQAQEKSKEEPGPACDKKFPKLSEQCRQWCWPEE